MSDSPSPSTTTPATKRGLGSRIFKLLPYAIAALALFWVFRSVKLEALQKAFADAPLLLFVGVSAIMLLLNCAADTFAMRTVFRWFDVTVPFFDLYVVRGSTYLLAVINYHVGQAAIVGYLYRARRVPLYRATGVILFIIGVNVGTLFLLASAGAARATGDLAWMRWIPVGFGFGGVFYAILLKVKPAFLVKRTLFGPLFEMGIRGHLRGVLVRLPHVGVLLVWHWLSLRMFKVQIPPGDALLYLPALFAVGSLPINVNGFGAAQSVAIAFFSPYVTEGDPKSAVLAYSLATTTVALVLQLLLGLLCLRRATRLGVPTTEEEVPSADIAADPTDAASGQQSLRVAAPAAE